MARHFGWAHDFWRRTPTRPKGIGWRELQAWITAMNTQNEGVKTAPDSWAGAEHDPWWIKARAAREASRR